jgi:hypothetical protein
MCIHPDDFGRRKGTLRKRALRYRTSRLLTLLRETTYSAPEREFWKKREHGSRRASFETARAATCRLFGKKKQRT